MSLTLEELERIRKSFDEAAAPPEAYGLYIKSKKTGKYVTVKNEQEHKEHMVQGIHHKLTDWFTIGKK